MKEIPLTRGKVALVSNEDFEHVSKFKWYARKAPTTFYARRTDRSEGSPRTILLHRFILGLTDPKIETDHRDGNGLNCTRENIRACTQTENAKNRKMQHTNTVGFKGVARITNSYRYQARIWASGKNLYLGCFSDPLLAAKAYDAAARKYHKDFARLNFPNGN